MYLSLKYCEKSIKTCAGYLGHLTMSHRFFFMKVVIDAIKMSMTSLFFAFFCMSIAPRNHPPTLEIITPQPWGLPPNNEDYPPTLRITPQPWMICDPSLVEETNKSLLHFFWEYRIIKNIFAQWKKEMITHTGVIKIIWNLNYHKPYLISYVLLQMIENLVLIMWHHYNQIQFKDSDCNCNQRKYLIKLNSHFIFLMIYECM